MGKNQHVVPVGKKWGIRGEGNTKLTSTFDRQSDAIAAARQISRNHMLIPGDSRPPIPVIVGHLS